jgi:hypothetical protein
MLPRGIGEFDFSHSIDSFYSGFRLSSWSNVPLKRRQPALSRTLAVPSLEGRGRGWVLARIQPVGRILVCVWDKTLPPNWLEETDRLLASSRERECQE